METSTVDPGIIHSTVIAHGNCAIIVFRAIFENNDRLLVRKVACLYARCLDPLVAKLAQVAVVFL